MDIYHNILRKYWGYSEFRPLQEEIIHAVCSGKDTLGLMPTGGGKSITFQVSALTMEGICLVVTPLIALMQDQVENLQRIGIQATTIHSGMNRKEMQQRLNLCLSGNCKFLYVSPERLTSAYFREKLQAMNICLLVVDEAHCISQWGYDFRPAYLQIADIREQIPHVPVLALTATATSQVIEDIQSKLLFKEYHLLKKSFDRPNLSYIIRKTEDKLYTLIYILRKIAGSTIVYVRNRRQTREIATQLQQAGISANFFHAGLSREEKTARQSAWKNDQCRVMVATNAFGMGIDKADVRLVIHIQMPSSLEEYFQEAGRAGRDEQKAYAIVLNSQADSQKLSKQLEDEYPDKHLIQEIYESLCNHYAIQTQEGAHEIPHFSFSEFCATASFTPLQVHHALRLLDLSGYLEYHEEQYETNQSAEPQIYFTHPIVKKKELHIPYSVYEERRTKAEERIKKVRAYLDSERICRNHLLLSYFGERYGVDCGRCDVCLSKEDSGLTNQDFNQIRSLLIENLSRQTSISIQKFVEISPFTQEKTIKAIRFLIEHEDNLFQLMGDQIGMKQN
ncbi:MAG: ATP-dependent DNA helicase RecQ [Parabacteroides sp.]|nr:ATP-dependent DNA helicase RecQ [Parabacteroides sp.]